MYIILLTSDGFILKIFVRILYLFIFRYSLNLLSKYIDLNANIIITLKKFLRKAKCYYRDISNAVIYASSCVFESLNKIRDALNLYSACPFIYFFLLWI